ncbi:MAG: hypothetical protein EOO19_07640 [Chryseobacterium sp.]|nr:MAG: hypothetical protein EOO19_07640 [Chryseobacterium sp.]
MEKITIQYLPEVEQYINELSYTLFEKEYFGFLESSFDYIDNLIDFLEYNLPIFPYRSTPLNLIDLGSKYIFYKANQNTTWYIFFENLDNHFLVTFITNNYSEIVQYLQKQKSLHFRLGISYLI